MVGVPGTVLRRLSASAVGLCLLFAGLLAASSPVAASELEEAHEGAGIVPAGDGWRVPAGAWPYAMWPWETGRRTFMRTETGIVAVDPRNGDEFGRVALDPPPFRTWGFTEAFYGTAPGRAHTMALDEAGGRLFVPYGGQTFYNKQWLPLAPLVWGLTWPTSPSEQEKVVQTPAASAQEGRLCASQWHLMNGADCVAGYHEVDAETLEVVRTVPLSNLGAETNGSASILRSVVFSPPLPGESGSGKLHLLVEDFGPALDVWVAQTRQYGQTSTWHLIQFDPDTGAREWSTRIEPCRGTRDDPSDPGYAAPTHHHPWPGISLRSTRPDDRSIWVGCMHGSGRQAVVVRVPLDEQYRPYTSVPSVGGAPEQASPEWRPTVTRAPRQEGYVGPEYALEYRADPVTGRLLARANRDATEVWWVFDPTERSYIGAIGIGEVSRTAVWAELDPVSGRFYVQATRTHPREVDGLFVADLRRPDVAQALLYPRLDGQYLFSRTDAGSGRRTLSVIKGDTVALYQDLLADAGAPVAFDIEGATLDLDEAPGVTSASFDGAARGYGARAILVGGLQSAARVAAVDPFTTPHRYYTWSTTGLVLKPVSDRVPWNPCLTPNREVVLAFVGPENPATMTGDGSRGGVQPLMTDPLTQGDTHRPIERCGPMNWGSVWQAALFGRPPAEEPEGLPPWVTGSRISCVSQDEEPEASYQDEVAGTFAAQVACGDEDASGFAQARGVSVGELSVSEAASSFRIYRDPLRGLVSRIESVARGVLIEGLVRIDTVRGTAEAWANGRRQPVAAADQDPAYDANCDPERTAGTCFRRHLFGVSSKGYSCGPCGDEDALVAGLRSAFGSDAVIRLREPDAALARGAENGYMAAIVKRDVERSADLLMNEDLLQTTVPTLEIVRFAASSQYGPGTYGDPEVNPPRGRQIYQFAGVEVSSTYSVECLLHYDPERNVCADALQDPGALSLRLTDGEGGPLAGGAFEVRRDTDADGIVGLADTLLPEGACVTAEDGVGTCAFDALAPGDYLVRQTAAPPGFAPAPEPFAVALAAGERREVVFTNISDVSVVEVTATDADGAPASGAGFAVYPDADADGKVPPDTPPAAECTTGADGTCAMHVPSGAYVLVQTVAPAGLEPMEPVPFTFAGGGQTATVSVVNVPVGGGGVQAPPPAAAPVYGNPVSAVPPMERVSTSEPPAPVAAPRVGLPDRVGGTVVQVIRAPGDAFRLLAREPAQAAAWMASLALLCLAVTAVRRRRRTLALLVP